MATDTGITATDAGTATGTADPAQKGTPDPQFGAPAARAAAYSPVTLTAVVPRLRGGPGCVTLLLLPTCLN
jgi:hypothetical protein